MAKFPHSYCFHGGEHVVSLFFSSIAKIGQIQVSIYSSMFLVFIVVVDFVVIDNCFNCYIPYRHHIVIINFITSSHNQSSF